MLLRFYYLMLFCCLFLASCKEKTIQATDPRLVTDSIEVRFTDSLRIKTRLLPEAAEITAQSEAYSTLADAVDGLNHSKIGRVKNEVDAWVEAALKLYEKFKDTLTNHAIDARVIVLNTKVRVLRQEVLKIQVDTMVINQEATEFYNAFQDFGFQLNLKFGKSVDDLLKDFKAENEKRRIDALERKAKSAETDSVNRN